MREVETMVMSQFSLIGIIVLMVFVIAGTVVKIILRRERKKLDGFHGYVNIKDDESEDDITDDWESI